jgi:hypothetical protein
MTFRKITSFVVTLSVLLLMQFAECQSMSADQQAMKCCRTMPCHPANHKHDCCKNMVSPQILSILPSPHVPLSIPVVVPAGPLPETEIAQSPEIFWPKIDAPQHAPPDLYIIYASLLI